MRRVSKRLFKSFGVSMVLSALLMGAASQVEYRFDDGGESHPEFAQVRSEDSAVIATEEYEKLIGVGFNTFQPYSVEMIGRKLVKVQGRFGTDGDCRIEQIISPDPVIDRQLGVGWSHVSHAIARDLNSCQAVFERGFVRREEIEKLLGLPPLLEVDK